MKKLAIVYLIMMVILLSMNGCKKEKEQKKLVFENYSNLKLGFTTQNFIECIPVSIENALHFIDYAKEQGYHWIELRDPDAKLTVKECKDIASYADNQGIEVGYAIQKGLLDADFWSTFKQGVKNAAVFKGPGTIRALASGNEFMLDTQKVGWTQSEIKQLVTNAKKAAEMAKNHGLQFVIENGNEPLYGKKGDYYGLSDIFEKTSPAVGWQFDTGNPFSGSRVSLSTERVKQFFTTYIDRLHYIHLKASPNGEAQPFLKENPLSFEVIFAGMNQKDVPYIAIEHLVTEDDEKAEVYNNHEKSNQFLKEHYSLQ